jgi:hypothetical protein
MAKSTPLPAGLGVGHNGLEPIETFPESVTDVSGMICYLERENSVAEPVQPGFRRADPTRCILRRAYPFASRSHRICRLGGTA